MSVWMLSTLLAASMVAGAALAAEEVARMLRLPRRWGWVVAMTASATLPLLFRLFPVRVDPVASAGAADPEMLARLMSGAEVGEAPAGVLALLRSPAADPYLIGIWLAVVTAVSAALLLTWLRLRRVRIGASPVEIAGIPALLTRVLGPMVVGVRRPQVVVPRWIAALPDDELRLVVRHEWEHVRAGDTRLLLFSAVLVAAMPWNLPLWWMRRRLRQAMEVDCDARVLASGVDRRLYGQMLIQTAGRPAPTPLLAPALVEPPTLLERRIVAMTTKRPAHPRLRAAAAGTLGLSLFVAACELTPRSTAISPTEPTLAEVVDGNQELVVVDFPQDPERIVGTVAAPDGQVRVGRITPDGDTTWLSADRIRIRASPFQSIAGNGEQPIYIVNGVEVEELEQLAPNTIAEISVVKGDAAVAEFGERGRNGVVKITTRRGGTGRVSVADLQEELVAYEAAALSWDDPDVTRVQVEPRGAVRAVGGATFEPAAMDRLSPEAAAAVGRATEIIRARSAAAVQAGTIEGATNLEGTVAVGYGTAARASAATQTIEGEAVTVVGYGTPRRTPGAVRPEDAALNPGAPVRLRVRADGLTRAPAAEPLILVDGETVASLAELNRRYPADRIQSIQVLKDASATAVYGERGRNGVIIVELKK